jgi:hypothetical protein
MKQPSWIKNAYKGTKVNWAKTQADIYKKLGEMGIYEIRFTNLRDKFALEFLITIEEGAKPRGVRIVIPLQYTGDSEEKRTKELSLVHRVLINHLKAKFLAIANGLTEFEQEFMAHLIITDNAGNSRTMGEMLLPEYKKQIDEGKAGSFELLPAPKKD